ncbi:hypothetical protein J2W30_003621 [Variovorax boronicumulans]|uniref:hypothetical protein n=1 Tax=Variovorax boronicumulans TaxID=436515 RepID=UPI00278267C3|nr:hypothetical protein [Variovorax boronicumulans]MDQ0035853.1 hypothetical protein [Variovorax boronicumulans]
MSNARSISAAEPQHLAELYRQIFEVDKRGAAILEDLVKRFSKPASVQGGIDAVLKTYLHMGEHNVVQHIVNQINRANGVRDPNQEQEQ